MPTLKLTPYQAEVLDDRSDDCIPACFDEWKDEYHHDIVFVKYLIRGRKIDVDALTPRQKLILEDCYAGSTVYGQIDDGDPSREAIMNRARVARTMKVLHRKMVDAGCHLPHGPVLW